MVRKANYTIALILLFLSMNAFGQGDGFITDNGKKFFPIGMYYVPEDEAKLKEMADAGFNLVRCHSKEMLDRVNKAGLKGWMVLPLQNGANEKFKELVNSVVDHPALALWEGPDEIIHTFTNSSRLYRTQGIHKVPNAWRKQTPEAVKYAKERAGVIMPNMISAISYLRSVDEHNRQLWINEAPSGNIGFVRQYLDYIDITGCAFYPIGERKLANPEHLNEYGIRGDETVRLNGFVQRFNEIGKGKPVYSVLQAFAWPELGEKYKDRDTLYPSFTESRYMAYLAIAYGAKGINYWGAHYTKNDEFLHSIYAVASELEALQPFLTSVEQDHIKVEELLSSDAKVSCIARNFGREWLVVVINETANYKLDLMVENLEFLNGVKLTELYGSEEVVVSNEEFPVRLKPWEVKVFATSNKWETTKMVGRDYKGQ